MRLVKFNNGKYGVRTYWFFGWNFLSGCGYYFSDKPNINKHCHHSKEKALEIYHSHQCKYEIVND